MKESLAQARHGAYSFLGIDCPAPLFYKFEIWRFVMKRILLILLSALLLVCLFACEDPANPPEQNEENPPLLNLAICYTEELPAAEGATNFVQFKMKGGATFVVELYPEYAPKTVENFKKLVGEGFYNGLTFHRIYYGFMIQGGDPKGDGLGTIEGGTIEGEFSSNGFTQNTLKHERGVISMARRTEPNSASCQFFIMHDKNSTLDGRYAAFGRVVAGMETVDTIASLPVTTQTYSTEKSKPVEAPVMESVTFVNFTAQ